MRNTHDNSGTSPHRSAKPGDVVIFGKYPQTADGTDRTPISWRVLQNSGGKLFLLSEHVLDCKRYHNDRQPYHSEDAAIVWRDCDLRKWLNGDFYDAAFSATDKKLIATTLCKGNGADSPDTKDKIFLLGVAEVQELIGVLGKNICRATGTEFAKARKPDGCHLYVYDKSSAVDYVVENGQKHGCSWWWLRTQGNHPSRAYFIGTHASIRSYARVNLGGYGVRPALRIKLGDK